MSDASGGQREIQRIDAEVAATGVLAIVGAPESETRRRWTALLSLGDSAVLSHEWAGRVEGLPAMPSNVWSLIVPTGDHRRRSGLTIHQQQLDAVDRIQIDGFPVTALPRTVCDLATVVSTARLRPIVEGLRFDRGCSISSIGTTLLRVGTVGRPGAMNLSRVLDFYGPGAAVSMTAIEARLVEVVAAAGLPVGVSQYPLPGVGRRSGLVDRAFPEAKLIVEADGRKWHARAQAMVADRQRDLEAARSRWWTVRLMYEQLVSDPDDVAAALAETFLGRLAEVA
jgi:hypothetical protein